MGNPLAPALANVFLCHIEDLIFSTCPDSYKPKFYRRYLDDTFAVFDSETQATIFFQLLIVSIKIYHSPLKNKSIENSIFRFMCGQ